MLVGLSLFVVFASFFAYRHPPASWTLPWLPKRHIAPVTEKHHEPSSEGKSDSDERPLPNSRLSTSPDGTPKAAPTYMRVSVPSFALDGHDESSDDDDDKDDMRSPAFPALNSAQRASVPTSYTSALNLSTTARSSIATLMLPPRLPASTLRPQNSTMSALRPPSNGPLPNRGPPRPLQPSQRLATPITAATQTPNPRKKVILGPEYSPLHWAELTRTTNNLSGVDKLIRVTPSMLKEKNGRKGKPAWSSYHGRVYNITPYLPFHPGGEGELRRAAGKDGGKLFAEVHPWVNWEGMLATCVVGIMVGEEEGELRRSPLEEMD